MFGQGIDGNGNGWSSGFGFARWTSDGYTYSMIC